MKLTRDSKGRFVSNHNIQVDPYPDINRMSAEQQEDYIYETMVSDFTTNSRMSRSSFFNQFQDPRRDYNKECGYPSVRTIRVEEIKDMYEREGIATRVVHIIPNESWLVTPEIYEDDNPKVLTRFERAWRSLAETTALPTWNSDRLNSKIWGKMKRLDQLMGIGRYGVMLVGINDRQDLSKPVIPRLEYMDKDALVELRKNNDNELKLLYLRPFDESDVKIARFVQDRNNPRYQQPEMYQIEIGEINDADGALGLSNQTIDVHWQRVIHCNDDDEVFGTPRLRPVFRRVIDLEKVYGGSAEMYWRGAFPGLSIEMNPDWVGEGKFDKKAYRKALERYQNTLQRYILLEGATAKSISPQVADPSAQLDAYITAVCIQIGVPKRVFMGSEAGQLASEVDAAAWKARMKDRQAKFLTPNMVCKFIDRLIAFNVLPMPVTDYKVAWPDMEAPTSKDKAALATSRMTAAASYIGSGVDELMAPEDFWTREMDYSEAEANTIIKNVEEYKKKKREEQLAKQQEQLDLQQENQVEMERLVGGLDRSGDVSPSTGSQEAKERQNKIRKRFDNNPAKGLASANGKA